MIAGPVPFLSSEVRFHGRQSGAELRNAWFASALMDVAVAILGVTSLYSVRLVGDLPIAEILMLVLLPFLLAVRGRLIFRKELLPIYGLCALWLFAQILSDLSHGMTAPQQWMRSYAAITFFSFDIMLMAALTSGSTRRKLIFLGAFAVSSLIRVRFFPLPVMAEEPWKFGYADGVINLTLLVSCFFYARRRNAVVVLLLLGLIGINLIENFRSPLLFLFVVLAIVIPVIPERIGSLQLLPRKGSALRVISIVAFSLAAGLAARQVLAWATEKGLSGEEGREKNEAQAVAGSGIQFLFSARPEFPVATKAVADSPLLGHGSAPDEPKYREMLNDMLEEMGQQSQLEDELELMGGLIPVHSFLLQAWVSAGVLGSLIWFYLLALCVKSIVRVAIVLPPTAPYITFLFILFFWNIFFSPFGSTERLTVACTILLMVDLPKPEQPMRSIVHDLHLSGSRRGRWTRQGSGRPLTLRS
jgi:hypothetical protein